MSYSNFRKFFLWKLESYAADSCGVVCYRNNECDGHRTLKYLQRYENFMIYNVEERDVFYKNISIIKQGKNTDPLMGYIFILKDIVDLRGKSWFQRLSYLNYFFLYFLYCGRSLYIKQHFLYLKYYLLKIIKKYWCLHPIFF